MFQNYFMFQSCKIFKVSAVIIAGAAVCALQSPAVAQTVTGTVDATISLTSACEVNGSDATSGVDFGTLDFGSHTTLFSEATTELQSDTGSGISIQCSPGSDASLTVTGGSNDAAVPGSGRAMSNGSLFVPYDLYSDAALEATLSNGTSIPVVGDGTVQVIPIYGRALGNALLTPGTYSDTVAVTLSF